MEHIGNLSFENILAQNRDRLWRLCRAYNTNTDDAKDLFQEIALNIWTGLKTYRGDAAINTWVYRIALNSAINYSIRLRRDGKNMLSLHVIDFSTEINTKDDERVLELYRFIGRLNDADRSLITLYLEDFSHKEIAGVLGISENYVAVKLARVREKLANYFKPII
jgi:RNA polymerase sigma-70 factor (ECF subfamily)